MLFVRHVAWLRSRNKGELISRMDQRNANGFPLGLPDLGGLRYIYDWLEEAGIASRSFDGEIPLSWSELKAWRCCTDAIINSWESLTMIKMSRAYCQQISVSDDKQCEPPNYIEVTESDMAITRAKADKTLRNLF